MKHDYLTQLKPNNLKESLEWLARAMNPSPKMDVRTVTQDAPDLEELWNLLLEI
jgi:hypothetical protein